MGQVRRRQFLIAAGLILASPCARAQQPRGAYRVVYAGVAPLPSLMHLFAAFEQGLRERGYVVGKDVVMDYRSVEGRFELYPEIVQQLLSSKPDVILTATNVNTIAWKAATQTIPIVMVLGTDVVGRGFAESLARPGRNVTGLTMDVGRDTLMKRLELLRETVPRLSRAAVLYDPPYEVEYRGPLDEAAEALGLRLIWMDISNDFERSFGAVLRARVDAVFLSGGGRQLGRRTEVVALAQKHRLPTSFDNSDYVDAGGLMSYGPNFIDLCRRAATYVDKILKGTKPGDLPIEQPTKFELVINLKTANALGLIVPPSLLVRADRVIE